jgi:hypothetical protein
MPVTAGWGLTLADGSANVWKFEPPQGGSATSASSATSPSSSSSPRARRSASTRSRTWSTTSCTSAVVGEGAGWNTAASAS